MLLAADPEVDLLHASIHPFFEIRVDNRLLLCNTPGKLAVRDHRLRKRWKVLHR